MRHLFVISLFLFSAQNGMAEQISVSSNINIPAGAKVLAVGNEKVSGAMQQGASIMVLLAKGAAIVPGSISFLNPPKSEHIRFAGQNLGCSSGEGGGGETLQPLTVVAGPETAIADPGSSASAVDGGSVEGQSAYGFEGMMQRVLTVFGFESGEGASAQQASGGGEAAARSAPSNGRFTCQIQVKANDNDFRRPISPGGGSNGGPVNRSSSTLNFTE